MGEYANYKGQSVKIGTCEDMLYLRADQAHLVTPKSGNVNPAEDAYGLRFRFPFPDEDTTEPGNFSDAFRSLPISIDPPTGTEHNSVQFKADAGYLVSLPCPEDGANKPTYKIHRNGFGGAVQIVQQKWVDGKLCLVCKCGGCGAKYRIEEFSEVEPIIEACREEARRVNPSRNAAFWNAVADRIENGYLCPLPDPHKARRLESIEA